MARGIPEAEEALAEQVAIESVSTCCLFYTKYPYMGTCCKKCNN